jgi:hypothetical protein
MNLLLALKAMMMAEYLESSFAGIRVCRSFNCGWCMGGVWVVYGWMV